MLSDARISKIQQFKGTANFSIRFIKKFDREWGAVVEQLKGSKVNLAAITIVSKSVEYKNVRT